MPKYRGRCPVNWALINGENETGATLHEMVREPDAGDIVMQEKVTIEQNDTAYTLFGKITDAAVSTIKKFYPLLDKGSFKKIPQNHSRATVFGGRKPQDGSFTWDQDARSIYNLVRAVTHPYPGAFTTVAGRNFTVWWAQPYDGEMPRAEVPGTILSLKRGAGVTVAVSKGALLLKRVQWDGEEEKSADLFARDNKLKVGAILR